jgi:hypothetical protein
MVTLFNAFAEEVKMTVPMGVYKDSPTWTNEQNDALVRVRLCAICLVSLSSLFSVLPSPFSVLCMPSFRHTRTQSHSQNLATLFGVALDHVICPVSQQKQQSDGTFVTFVLCEAMPPAYMTTLAFKSAIDGNTELYYIDTFDPVFPGMAVESSATLTAFQNFVNRPRAAVAFSTHTLVRPQQHAA